MVVHKRKDFALEIPNMVLKDIMGFSFAYNKNLRCLHQF